MMKTFTPGKAVAMGNLVWAAFWTAIGFAGSGWMVRLVEWLASIQGRIADAADLRVAFAVPLLLAGIIVLLCLACVLNIVSSRYVLGPTELTIHSGALWKSSRTLPILEINRIEISSGPFMRLLGLSDLKLYKNEPMPVTLYGLRDAGGVRKMILDRRESLHESALEGGVSYFKTPQDLLFERLDRVLERIEHHLPPVPPVARGGRGL